MEDKDTALIAATILGGLIAGERASADEKTIKRAIDLAVRLKTMLEERKTAAPSPAVP